MPIPANTYNPSFIDANRLYSLRQFIKDSGISVIRIRLAKRAGIELPVLKCGKRKFVRGTDGIAYIERLAAHDAANAKS